MLFLIIKRILLGFITLFIVSLITFVGTEILPGDACTTYLERQAFGEQILVILMTTSGTQKNQELKQVNVRLLDLIIPTKIFQFIKTRYIIFIQAKLKGYNRFV